MPSVLENDNPLLRSDNEKHKGKPEILEPNNEAKTPSKTQVVSGA